MATEAFSAERGTNISKSEKDTETEREITWRHKCVNVDKTVLTV